jgi:hypothetical protein
MRTCIARRELVRATGVVRKRYQFGYIGVARTFSTGAALQEVEQGAAIRREARLAAWKCRQNALIEAPMRAVDRFRAGETG